MGAEYTRIKDLNLTLEINITATPQGPSAISKENFHNPSSYQIGWANILRDDQVLADYRIRFREQLIQHRCPPINWRVNPAEQPSTYTTIFPSGRIEIDGHIVGNATQSGSFVQTPAAGTFTGNAPFASQTNNMYLDVAGGFTHTEVPPPSSLPVLASFTIDDVGLPTEVRGLLWPNWTAQVSVRYVGYVQ
jgi:hypothetical protein